MLPHDTNTSNISFLPLTPRFSLATATHEHSEQAFRLSVFPNFPCYRTPRTHRTFLSFHSPHDFPFLSHNTNIQNKLSASLIFHTSLATAQYEHSEHFFPPTSPTIFPCDRSDQACEDFLPQDVLHVQALASAGRKKVERSNLPTIASKQAPFASVFPNKPHRDSFESPCPSGLEHSTPRFF